MPRPAAYVERRPQAHKLALKLHSNQGQIGDTPQLRQVAADAVPIMEQHIRKMAAALTGARVVGRMMKAGGDREWGGILGSRVLG